MPSVTLTLESACSGDDVEREEEHPKGDTDRRHIVVAVSFRDTLATDIRALFLAQVRDTFRS